MWKQTTYPRALTSPLQADLRDYAERALNSSRGSVDNAEAAAAARAARTSVSLCRDLAFPATYTPLIEKLNQAARELFAPMGVLIWEEPALMTFNAPGGWIVARHGRGAGQQAPACTQPTYAPATAPIAVPTTAPLRPAWRTRARPRTPVDGICICADHLMSCPRHVLPQGPYALRRVRGRGGEIRRESEGRAMRFVPNEWRRGHTRKGTECDHKEQQQGQNIVRRTRQRVEPALLGTHGIASSSVARSPWKLASPAPDHSLIISLIALLTPQAEKLQTLPWAGTGGLSEAVTQTLFPLLNCTCG